jgi:hypothetical protein
MIESMIMSSIWTDDLYLKSERWSDIMTVAFLFKTELLQSDEEKQDEIRRIED